MSSVTHLTEVGSTNDWLLARAEALPVINNLIERRVLGQLSEAHTLRRYSEELDRRRREAVGEA